MVFSEVRLFVVLNTKVSLVTFETWHCLDPAAE